MTTRKEHTKAEIQSVFLAPFIFGALYGIWYVLGLWSLIILVPVALIVALYVALAMKGN